jgi:hypothetical protein
VERGIPQDVCGSRSGDLCHHWLSQIICQARALRLVHNTGRVAGGLLRHHARGSAAGVLARTVCHGAIKGARWSRRRVGRVGECHTELLLLLRLVHQRIRVVVGHMTVRRPGGIAPAVAARRERLRHPRIVADSALRVFGAGHVCVEIGASQVHLGNGNQNICG